MIWSNVLILKFKLILIFYEDIYVIIYQFCLINIKNKVIKIFLQIMELNKLYINKVIKLYLIQILKKKIVFIFLLFLLFMFQKLVNFVLIVLFYSGRIISRWGNSNNFLKYFYFWKRFFQIISDYLLILGPLNFVRMCALCSKNRMCPRCLVNLLFS